MRLIDADELLKGKTDHEMISTHLIFNAPTVDVLDKIRDEIAEYGSIWVAYAITDKTKTDEGIEKLVSDVLKQAKEQVLEIIDKYREEQTDAT